MSVKAGVWIDHRQAILVLLTDDGHDIKKFASETETTGRLTPKSGHPSPNLVPEDKQDRKVENDLKHFYDEVIAGLQGLKSLLILGPGEAKGEFHKRLESKKVHGLVMEVKTADRMTDGQLVAKIVQHFAAGEPISAK